MFPLTSEAVEELKLSSDLEPQQQQQLKKLILKYSHIFACQPSDLERARVPPFTINTGDTPPIRHQPRRTSQKNKEVIRDKIQELLNNGVIEPCDGPWSFPVVIVHKEGKDPRLCIDYRQLNNVTRKNAYPLPRIGDILDDLGPSKYFTTLDAKSGYHQIPVHPQDKDKTCFTTYEGNYRWTGMPFGLCNAPAAYQYIMDTVFQRVLWKFVLTYVDDTVVYSQTFEEHLIHLEEVFKRISDVGLKLHIKKCHFAFNHLDLLGHHVSAEGTGVQQRVVDKLLQYPVPKDLKELRSFVGLANYYKAFVKDYSVIMNPLYKLMRKHEKYVWKAEQQKAFETIRTALTSPPILARPNFTNPFILSTDASKLGLGASLSQLDEEGHERLISCISRTLTSAERNYSATDLELLAIKWAVQQYYHYLHGNHFDIYTDHAPLRGLLKNKEVQEQNSRVCRTTMYLQGFDYTLHYRKGKANQAADALSRLEY
jgi:hypothetical protein